MGTIFGPCQGFEDLTSCLDVTPVKLMEARVEDGRQFAKITAEDVLTTLLTYYQDLDIEVIRHGPVWSRKLFAKARAEGVADFVVANFDPEIGIDFPDSPSGRQVMLTTDDLETAAKTGVPWTNVPWPGTRGDASRRTGDASGSRAGGASGSGAGGASGSGSRSGDDLSPQAS